MLKMLLVVVTLILLTVFPHLGSTAKLEGLILAFPFDEGKGETVKDVSGKDFVGKGSKTKWTDGKFGKALEFNGKDAHVEVPGGVIADLPNNQISFGAWFFLIGHNGYDRMVTMTGILAQVGEKCCRYRIMATSGMNPFYDMGEHADIGVGTFTFKVKKWYHYVATYDSKEVKIFVDGELIHTQAKKVKLPEFETPLLVGTGEAPGVHPTHGLVDEMFVYDRAISQQEIKDSIDGFEVILRIKPRGKLSVS